jgi:hypothetical protein
MVDPPTPEPDTAEAVRIDWTAREQPRYLTMLTVVGVWALAVVELALVELSIVKGTTLPLVSYAVVPLFGIVAGAVIWRAYRSEPTRLGIAANGLHISWGRSEVAVPWSYVVPAFLSTRWESYPLFYRIPGHRFLSHIFLTPMQARALLTHPDRPDWPVEPKVRERLQLAARA